MTFSQTATRNLAWAFLPLALAGSMARAQTAPDSIPGAVANPAAGMGIVLSPAQPRQGSVVRITVRPVSAARDSARPAVVADTAKRDTLPSVTIVLRPGVDSARSPIDSLRAVLDTLSLRTDTSAFGAARADTLRADDIVSMHATLFGEPLHFERQPDGEYVAIGGIPVDAPASLRVPIVVTRANGDTDTTIASLAVRRTAYKMEKLTVAPKFGQAPDSALAARIAREQALAAEVSRRSHATPRLWRGEFQRPRTARVTSAFGDGRQFNGRIQSRHMGLDLAGATGSPVLATNRGVVALVGAFYYAGNAVYIDHGAGLVTAYFHLSAVDVAEGDTVTPGVRIGQVGATGRVTGPHLHWVARYGGITVDPSTLLELKSADDAGDSAPINPAKDVVKEPAKDSVPPAAKVPPPAIPVPPVGDDQLAASG
jgi:murein DD-endopeptidase MepM/ murein hydrolase activator NlpD